MPSSPCVNCPLLSLGVSQSGALAKEVCVWGGTVVAFSGYMGLCPFPPPSERPALSIPLSQLIRHTHPSFSCPRGPELLHTGLHFTSDLVNTPTESLEHVPT